MPIRRAQPSDSKPDPGRHAHRMGSLGRLLIVTILGCIGIILVVGVFGFLEAPVMTGWQVVAVIALIIVLAAVTLATVCERKLWVVARSGSKAAFDVGVDEPSRARDRGEERRAAD